VFDYDVVVIGAGSAGLVACKLANVRAVVQADADGHPPESYEAEGINVLFGGQYFNYRAGLHQIGVFGVQITSIGEPARTLEFLHAINSAHPPSYYV